MKVFYIPVIFLLIFSFELCFGTFVLVVNVKRRACFRRILAGKRVARDFVRRSLFCERLEDCQLECGEEKRFMCEGFNYRLDPTGRGKGECELLDVPLHRLDIGRDVYPDRDYDYYERDRNAAITNCQYPPTQPNYPQRPPPYRPAPPIYDQIPPRIPNYDRRPPIYDRIPYDYDNRRRPNYGEDITYHHQLHHHNTQHGYNTNIDRNDIIHHGIHYLPPNPTPIKPNKQNFKPYNGYGTKLDKPSYEINRHQYLPTVSVSDWGKYGGSYGNGYNFNSDRRYDKPLPILPPVKPVPYLPIPQTLEINLLHQGPQIYDIGENLILPAEPRLPDHSYLKEECSLRSATGFKLSKGIVKKFYAVPSIYDCELLCYKERSFSCSSYAFRYTISLSAPADNCYLSNKNYKDLNYYTDLQPDRDFDIYTMNNINKCEAPVLSPRHDSDCFWRVRSGQKLSSRVLNTSIKVKTIVDCQIECLKSKRFTCRAFSFRFGPPIPGNYEDNCLLTDWPFYDLDPKIDFIPDSGFEVYERGSFGHGCESYHFGVRRKPQIDPAIKIDQLCYIGFGSPARILPQATKKAFKARSQLECKKECSKLREGTLFQCMSFSFRSNSHGSSNCYLSDIYQRDLLPHIDYIYDPDSWLFAWDNFNPQCIELAHKPIHDLGREIEGRYPNVGVNTALDTWRAYSVSGWPCRRGHLCQENREAGFWFCRLEGGDANSWDYCCRPDHQCGYSSGFQYPWCYVGPDKTQWRKCSDRYYPYVHNIIDRLDNVHHNKPSYLPQRPPSVGIPYLPERPKPIQGVPYLPERPKPSLGVPYLPERPSGGVPYLPVYQEIPQPGFRPDRPPAPPQLIQQQQSLDDYETQFDQQFLEPPKPGGFGQPRHWPVSYLHKDMPPNITNSESRLMSTNNKNKKENNELNAIQKLIDIINSNDLKNIQYQITNQTNNMDDILFVKIPLPSNFTKDNIEKMSSEIKEEKILTTESTMLKRLSKSLDTITTTEPNFNNKLVPIYRKSYITRTNVTTHGRSSKNVN